MREPMNFALALLLAIAGFAIIRWIHEPDIDEMGVNMMITGAVPGMLRPLVR